MRSEAESAFGGEGEEKGANGMENVANDNTDRKKPKPKKKFWLVIGLVVIILAVVGGGWYYLSAKDKSETKEEVKTEDATAATSDSTSTSATTSTTETTTPTATDETADWKTYTNSTYNFSLKYPSSFDYREYNVSEDGPVGEFYVTVGENTGTSILTSDGLVTGDSASMRQDFHVAVYPTSSASSLSQPNGMDSGSTFDVTLGGKQAKKYTSANDGATYVVVNNSRRFELTIPSDASVSLKTNYNKIISTFQFTK